MQQASDICFHATASFKWAVFSWCSGPLHCTHACASAYAKPPRLQGVPTRAYLRFSCLFELFLSRLRLVSCFNVIHDMRPKTRAKRQRHVAKATESRNSHASPADSTVRDPEMCFEKTARCWAQGVTGRERSLTMVACLSFLKLPPFTASCTGGSGRVEAVEAVVVVEVW